MIRPLRRAHRRIALALALVLPALIAWALLNRPEPPAQASWPFEASERADARPEGP